MIDVQIILIICFLILIGAVSYLTYQTIQCNKNLEKMINAYGFNEEDLLTDYEQERLQREKELEQRVAEMQKENELVKEHFERTGSIAEEFHPAVKNLPHDSVNVNHTNQQGVEEYAE